jgi:hypothetical protein
VLCGDAKKAQQALSWHPMVSFEQLVGLMVDADLELAEREAKTKAPYIEMAVTNGKSESTLSPPKTL